MSGRTSDSIDLGPKLARLAAGLAAARRRLAAGRPAPMRDLAQQLIRLLAEAAAAARTPPADSLVALLAEVEQLIEVLQDSKDRLAAELRGQGERRGALRAYRPDRPQSHG